VEGGADDFGSTLLTPALVSPDLVAAAAWLFTSARLGELACADATWHASDPATATAATNMNFELITSPV
jgi:hypothetical protein